MDLKKLEDIPSWEWPETAHQTILETLRNPSADPDDRLRAAELAGDYTVMNSEIAEALLDIAGNAGETEELRGEAALSLGTPLEHADTLGFDDPEEMIISEPLFVRVKESLRALYMDRQLPDTLRRQILEAAVHAPEAWHSAAIRDAYASPDETWRLTAVFCMQFIRGYEDEILQALKSDNPDIHYQAVSAAGTWGIQAAWPHIMDLLSSEHTEKALLMAAIAAVPAIRPEAAEDILEEFAEHEDDDISEAAMEALAMLEMMDEFDEEEDDEEGR